MWNFKKKQEKTDNIEKETFTQEEIEHYERILASERAKCARAVEKQKEKVEQMTPKSFFEKMKSNKKKLEAEEKILDELEERLIELNAMNGLDLLIEERAKMKKSKFALNDSTVGKISDVISAAGNYVPLPGASAVTGLIGEIIKPKKK